MADQDVPMPGQVEFSADEEKAMRQGNAAANAASQFMIGSLPIAQTARKLFNSAKNAVNPGSAD